ncbi:MAG TPA: isoprenylcysteine carboxylmethyltransferase family protein [Candidatus Limnocylindria bacterium]|jgi:protein-S-isoprenylcysteine O-methyltransferase Ste14|nr:isoprenylcysteine carboxylmethyltransferase family protein [Candidatus Limnocylindria bacterium]
MDDRSLRIAVLLSAHVIFLSAAALRILRGQRSHQLVADAPWWIQYYPPLVWLPFVVAYVQPFAVDLSPSLQFIGLAIAVTSAAFAAWAMWSLGRSYGIRLDVFEGHSLKTDGPYRFVRHPMYLGIVLFHLGASLALQSPLLLGATALYVVPFTAIRIGAEERVLRDAFGERYLRYAERVPALIPFGG